MLKWVGYANSKMPQQRWMDYDMVTGSKIVNTFWACVARTETIPIKKLFNSSLKGSESMNGR